MGKILLIVVIALVVFVIIKRYKQSLQSRTPPLGKPAEDMVRCAHCNVNLPRSEAIYTRNEFFCTAEHQKLGKK